MKHKTKLPRFMAASCAPYLSSSPGEQTCGVLDTKTTLIASFGKDMSNLVVDVAQDPNKHPHRASELIWTPVWPPLHINITINEP